VCSSDLITSSRVTFDLRPGASPEGFTIAGGFSSVVVFTIVFFARGFSSVVVFTIAFFACGFSSVVVFTIAFFARGFFTAFPFVKAVYLEFKGCHSEGAARSSRSSEEPAPLRWRQKRRHAQCLPNEPTSSL
jgi:hypothetical protein